MLRRFSLAILLYACTLSHGSTNCSLCWGIPTLYVEQGEAYSHLKCLTHLHITAWKPCHVYIGKGRVEIKKPHMFRK
jgi:hypothetical protein